MFVCATFYLLAHCGESRRYTPHPGNTASPITPTLAASIPNVACNDCMPNPTANDTACPESVIYATRPHTRLVLTVAVTNPFRITFSVSSCPIKSCATVGRHPRSEAYDAQFCPLVALPWCLVSLFNLARSNHRIQQHVHTTRSTTVQYNIHYDPFTGRGSCPGRRCNFVRDSGTETISLTFKSNLQTWNPFCPLARYVCQQCSGL